MPLDLWGNRMKKIIIVLTLIAALIILGFVFVVNVFNNAGA